PPAQASSPTGILRRATPRSPPPRSPSLTVSWPEGRTHHNPFPAASGSLSWRRRLLVPIRLPRDRRERKTSPCLPRSAQETPWRGPYALPANGTQTEADTTKGAVSKRNFCNVLL